MFGWATKARELIAATDQKTSNPRTEIVRSCSSNRWRRESKSDQRVIKVSITSTIDVFKTKNIWCQSTKMIDSVRACLSKSEKRSIIHNSKRGELARIPRQPDTTPHFCHAMADTETSERIESTGITCCHPRIARLTRSIAHSINHNRAEVIDDSIKSKGRIKSSFTACQHIRNRFIAIRQQREIENDSIRITMTTKIIL